MARTTVVWVRGCAGVLVLAAAAAVASGCGTERQTPSSGPATTMTRTTLTGVSPYAQCGRRDPSVQRNAEVEPYVAASPRDPRRLIAVWQQDRRTLGGAVGIASAVSTDGGSTWRSQPIPGGAPCGAGGLTGVSDPWVAIGPDATAYLAALPFAARRGGRPGRAHVAVHRALPTPPGGEPGRWSPPTALRSGRGFDDKPSVTADPRRPGVAYVVWHREATTLLSTTRDGGMTWSTPRPVPSMRRTVGQVIQPLPGGGLLMTALGFGRGRRPFAAATSRDLGRTWSRRSGFGTRPAAHGADRRRDGLDLRAGAFPGVAPLADGTVVAVWARASAGGSAFVRAVSRDGGHTWSPTAVALRRPGRIFTPALAVAPGGTLGLSWSERRPPDRGRRAPADVYLATSSDGGRSWRSRRILGSFDLRRAPRAGRARFLGDYMGLVPVPGGFGVLVAVAPPVAVRGRSDVVFVRVTARGARSATYTAATSRMPAATSRARDAASTNACSAAARRCRPASP